jgi:hypothetical protein
MERYEHLTTPSSNIDYSESQQQQQQREEKKNASQTSAISFAGITSFADVAVRGYLTTLSLLNPLGSSTSAVGEAAKALLMT